MTGRKVYLWKRGGVLNIHSHQFIYFSLDRSLWQPVRGTRICSARSIHSEETSQKRMKLASNLTSFLTPFICAAHFVKICEGIAALKISSCTLQACLALYNLQPHTKLPFLKRRQHFVSSKSHATSRSEEFARRLRSCTTARLD